MLYEHVPDWIRATEAWKWLCGPGVEYVPFWNHIWALVTELAIWVLMRRIETRLIMRSDRANPLRAFRQQADAFKSFHMQPDPRGCATILFAGLFLAHGCWALLLSAVLDGGARFFYWSATWAWVAIALGVAVLVVNHRITPAGNAARAIRAGGTVHVNP